MNSKTKEEINFNQFSLKQLRAYCKENNLDFSGTKQTLINRLKTRKQPENQPASLTSTSSSAKKHILETKLKQARYQRRMREEELAIACAREEQKIIDELEIEELKGNFTKSHISTLSHCSYDVDLSGKPLNSTDLKVSRFLNDVESNSNVNFIKSNNDKKIDVVELIDTLHANSDIPKMTKFTGEPSDYPRFEAFLKEYVFSARINESKKWQRLFSVLSGRARDSVKFLDGVVGGFDEAISILKERFGEPYLIVNSVISSILNMKNISIKDGHLLQEFADKLRASCRILASLDNLNEITTDHMKQIVNKLPFNDQMKWRDLVCSIRPSRPSFSQLVSFVNDRARALNDPIFGYNIDDNVISNRVEKNTVHKNFSVSQPAKFSQARCSLCNETHKIWQCFKFSNMQLNKKLEFVTKNRLCCNCLNYGHDVTQCFSKSRCSITGCGDLHHTLIHDSITKSNNFRLKTINSTFLPIVPIKICDDLGNEVSTYALLDSGSENTFFSSKLVENLCLSRSTEAISLTTLSGCNSISANKTNIIIKSINSENEFKVLDAIGLKNLNLNISRIPSYVELKEFNHLKSARFDELPCKDVNVIIGSDVPHAFIQHEVLSGNPQDPVAIKTVFGWAVLGAVKDKVKTISCFYQSFSLNQETTEEISMDKDFLTMPIEKPYSTHDKIAFLNMKKHTKLIDGHYHVPMLWKIDPKTLPNNKYMAISRAMTLRKRFYKNPSFYEKYREVIDSYVLKGFAQRVSYTEDITKPIWYLPHHGVWNVNKPNKLRVVFDAAAKQNEMSLNNMLMEGPDLMNSLVAVLSRFRQYSVAMTADIEAMFHQVRVYDDDSNYLHFLWWENNLDCEPQNYKMNVHIFGAKCSPSVANYALKRCASDQSHIYSEHTLASVNKNFYVDDFLKSTPTLDQSLQLKHDITALLQNGGFNLTKWVSNSPIISQSTADEIYELDNNPVSIQRTLGVQWNVKKDCFQFSPNFKECSVTKRGILSTISSLFDPLGFVAPLTLYPKLILQDLWRNDVDWDDVLDYETTRKWNVWLNSIPLIASFEIPRCFIKSIDFISIELHTFCDASEKGLGVASYLRVEYKNKIDVNFVFGKSKTSPLKPVTIPRLELQAAVLGARISRMISDELELNLDKKYLWSDSLTTLCYIKNQEKRFSTFVASRIGEIIELTQDSTWRHIPGKENPADEGSRGMSSNDFKNDCRWLNGPAFLKLTKEFWPEIKENLGPVKLELKNFHVESTCNKFLVIEKLLSYYSDWMKLKRAVVWLQRFCMYKCKKPVENTKITTNELTIAEFSIIRVFQRKHFSKEFEALTKGKPLKNDSQIINLNPFYSNDSKVLRVGGRLQMNNINFNKQHQIIIPRNCHLSEIIIRFYHIVTLHSGVESTLTRIREKFWIVKGRTNTKSIISKCIPCRRANATPSKQIMANLPSARITASERPFVSTGVDFFGPIIINQGRKTVKRWGCIFVCMATKAIHLEIAPSLSTNDFLNILIQFQCRRGLVKELFCDNGTNFIGAEREIREFVSSWNKKHIEASMQIRDVQWSFNPPHGSHHGGLWERSIRSIKRAISAVSGKRNLDEHRLKTLFAEIEYMLNSRPITPLSDDINDMEPLTPNHFILLDNSYLNIFETKDQLTSRSHWKQVKSLASHFWKRWSSEYLPLLQIRTKWLRKQKNFHVGDLVMVLGEIKNFGKWPLARITRIIYSNDDNVRSVELKMNDSYFIRPITLLCFLESTLISAE